MKKTKRWKLSLIVPAYKQERTIQKDIENIEKSLRNYDLDYELIVVVDGKLDKTADKLKKLDLKKMIVVQLEKNYGKGYAVRRGVERANGDIIGFLDAGMDIDPAGIDMLINHMMWYDADVIVGSKLHPVSQVEYPFYRKVLSWGYRKFTYLLFGFKVRDTQVGLKLFKKNVAKDVFSRSLVKKFAFDVEILALAYSLGYKKIYEAPIKLKLDKRSSIKNSNFWRIIFIMLIDTFAVFYRLKIKKYYKRSNQKNWLPE